MDSESLYLNKGNTIMMTYEEACECYDDEIKKPQQIIYVAEIKLKTKLLLLKNGIDVKEVIFNVDDDKITIRVFRKDGEKISTTKKEIKEKLKKFPHKYLLEIVKEGE